MEERVVSTDTVQARHIDAAESSLAFAGNISGTRLPFGRGQAKMPAGPGVMGIVDVDHAAMICRAAEA